jgi:hypothetical protein
MRLSRISDCVERTKSLLKVELDDLEKIDQHKTSLTVQDVIFIFGLSVSLLEQLLSIRFTLFPMPDQ